MNGGISTFAIFLWIIGSPMIFLTLDFFRTRAQLHRITL